MGHRRLFVRRTWIAAAAAGLVTSLLAPVAVAAPLAGVGQSTLPREPLLTPREIGSTNTADLLYADPTEGLAQITPPAANNTGSAEVSYPIAVPKGRGITPELNLTYTSGGGSSWVGTGWDLSVGDISVDTTWGAPLFCSAEDDEPVPCGNVESESYLLDGHPLLPSAVRGEFRPRQADREDFTHRVETEFQRIIRRGDHPKNYWWKVYDKAGNIRWYGGYPDAGGPNELDGDRRGRFENGDKRNPSAILTDDEGNGFRWYLSAMRDVGVNMFRYEYDTVHYSNDGGGWSPTDAGSCGSSDNCAKHVYLSKILYTGAAEDSGQHADPGYEIRFVREDGRADPVLDGRGGFLDLDRQKLTRIDVYYTAGDAEELVTSYRLEYGESQFGKTQLRAVSQVGCIDVDPCPPDRRGATHEFTYYDDVQDGSGFTDPVLWNTRDDNLDDAPQGDGASALGMSATNAGDVSVYAGFNGAAPSKTGSFGGSVSFATGVSESLVEFIDLNGDNLPDKVFLEGADPADTGRLLFRLNTSQPSDGLMEEVTFSSSTHEITGIDRLPIERFLGVTGGLEAYFGVFGAFHVGGTWNWGDSYFTDANGDGLVDFVQNGEVLFNHLECTGQACVPTFSSDDSETRVPLTLQSVETGAGLFDRLRRLLEGASPPVDTVRRWVAPFSGTVDITSTALLQPPTSYDHLPDVADNADATARISIQHNSSVQKVATLTRPDSTAVMDVEGLTVSKGDRIYFRTGSRSEGHGDEVVWDPTITYQAVADVADVNGLSQTTYRASEDFTLAGRPGMRTALEPPDGQPSADVRFTAVLVKAATSDDIEPRVVRHPGTGGPAETAHVAVEPVTMTGAVDADRVKSIVEDDGSFCVRDAGGARFGCYDEKGAAQERTRVIGASEVGRFRLTAEVSIAAAAAQSNGRKTGLDQLETRLEVDSPIDVAAIDWLQRPQICFLAGDDCADDSEIVHPHVDIDIYSRNTSSAVREPWQSSVDRTVQATAAVPVSGGTPAGDIVFTIKSETGELWKKTVHVDSTEGQPIPTPQHVSVAISGVDLADGRDYWFDVSTRSPGLGEHVGDVTFSVQWTEGEGDDRQNTKLTVPGVVNWVGRQGYFPLPYRGWGVAGYRSDGDRATERIHEDDFRTTPESGGSYDDEDEACQAFSGSDCMDDGEVDDMGFDYGAIPDDAPPPMKTAKATEQTPLVFAYAPELGQDLSRSWHIGQERIGATATANRAGRLAGPLPATGTTAGDALSAPGLVGVSGPVFSLLAGVGPLSGSFAFGWSHSEVDFIDMNGDGFPDIVEPDEVTYTNPRGGRGCVNEDGTVVTCDQDSGVDPVNLGTTVSVSGGFDGSPLSISGNAKGTTNATSGNNAASKSDSGSDDASGGGLGFSVSGGASFSNPNLDNPEWADEIDEVPGDPGAVAQQVLADVNGDGLPDQLEVDANGVLAYLNLGHGFTDDPIRWSTTPFETSKSLSGSLGGGFSIDFGGISGGVAANANVDFPQYSWQDVNGDGILDLMRKADDDVKVSFGTGTGLGSAAKYGDTGSLTFRVVPPFESDESTLTDQIRQDQSNGVGGGADFTIPIGPLCVGACYIIINPGGHFENALTETDVDMVDVNGDGYLDSVTRYEEEGQSNHERLQVRLNTQGRSGLLRTVTTPMGGELELDYERRGNTVDHPGSTWVLSDVVTRGSRGNDGVAPQHSTFAYDGLHYDFLTRQSLGFHQVTERQLDVDGDLMRSIEHVYHNESPFDTGLETRTTLRGKNGEKVQETVVDWRIVDLADNEPADLEGTGPDELLQLAITPQARRVEHRWYDDGVLAQKTRVDYAYSRLGDPVQITDHGELEDPADDLVAEIAYSRCTNAASEDLVEAFGCGDTVKYRPKTPSSYWTTQACSTWVSLPIRIKVYHDDPTKPLRYRDGSQAICDNASVTRLEEMIDFDTSIAKSPKAVTELSYDTWGSYNRIVYPENADGTHYGVFYTWDDKNHANIAAVTDLVLENSQVDTFLGDDLALDDTPIDPRDVLPGTIGVTGKATFDGPTGRVSSRQDPSGNVTRYGYDAMGRTKRITMPDGGSVTFDYHPGDAAYPYATAHHSDEFNGRPSSPDTIDTATFVGGFGQVTGRKREAVLFAGVDRQPVHGYAVDGATQLDALGRVTKEWYPTQQLTGGLDVYWDDTPDTRPFRRTWDALDRMLTETKPNDTVTRTTYGFAELDGVMLASTEVTDPLGRRTVTFTDVRENVRAVDDIAVGRDSLRTSYSYDPLGQLLMVTSPDAHRTTYSYDRLGRRLTTTTPDGGLVQYAYDAPGNLITEQSPVLRQDGDSETRYEYEFGHLVGIDYPDATRDVSFAWGGYDGTPAGDNGVGRIVEVIDGARHQVLGYDELGYVDSDTTTLRGEHPNNGPFTTTYDYDWLGRLADVTLPDGETVSHDYDQGGLLEQISGAKACTELGALTEPISAGQTTVTVTERPHSDTPVVPFTIRLGGEQLRVTARSATADPSVWTYTVERGVNGTPEAPTAVAHDAGATVTTDQDITCRYSYLQRREYDEFGARVFQELGNGVTTADSRDPETRRLTGRVTWAPGHVRQLQDLRYRYDVVGNLLRAENDLPTDVPSLFGGPSLQTYSYDSRYRLEHAEGSWDTAPKSRHKYTYDAAYDDQAGNLARAAQRHWVIDIKCRRRCKEDVQEATTFDRVTITYGGEGPHQRTSVRDRITGDVETYGYDADGNMTTVANPDMLREMTWNAAGKLSSITDHNAKGKGRKTTSYRYDFNGLLAIEHKEQGETYYVNPWVTVRDGTMWKNIWAGSDRLGVKFAQQDEYEQKIYYLHTDLQGSTNIVTDRVGKMFQHQIYFPTGQVWVDEDSTIFRTPYQFTGAYVDEDHGIVNMGQRWYSPEHNLFSSVDPALTSDVTALLSTPQLRSSYTYAYDNPLRYVDTTGRRGVDVKASWLGLRSTAQYKGKPMSTARLQMGDRFFTEHQGLRGRMAISVLKHQRGFQKLQSFAERWDAKPLIALTLDGGRLTSVKLSLGTGPRLKIAKGKASTPTSTSAASPGSGTAASTAGASASTSAGATGSGTAAGQGTSAQGAGVQGGATRPAPKPLPKPPAKPAPQPAGRSDS